MASLQFQNAEAARDAILDSQKNEISALYEQWAKEIGEKAQWYSHRSNASAPLSERQMRELQRQLQATSEVVRTEVENKIRQNIFAVADAVVKDNVEWLASLGFNREGINAAFTYVSDDIVRNLVTGQIYDSGWSLSSRIWGDNQQTLKDIYQIVARGVAENKPIYEIARDLERYVSPSARLPWNLTALDGARIYRKQVDYSAQRLARTLVQHGYQQSFVATTQKNPFVVDYVWHSNGSRVCPLCMDRDGQHYKKDELPLDHPNGMCTMEATVVDDLEERLVDWFNSPDGTYPEIDEFAKNFGYGIGSGSSYKRDLEAFDALWNQHKQIYDSLSREEQNAIKKYMSFSGVNENYKNKNLIDGAISQATLPENILLRRGVSDMPTNYADALSMVGQEIKTTIEGKPISTTIRSTLNFGTSTIEIKANEGTTGMFVDVARQSQQAERARARARKEGNIIGESEVLLPSNTIIEITGVHIDKESGRIIYEAILKQK